MIIYRLLFRCVFFPVIYPSTRGLITPDNINNIKAIFTSVKSKPSKQLMKELSKLALVQLHYLECEARASLGKRWSTLYLKVWFSIPAHSSTLLGSLYFCVHTHGVKLTSEFLQCMYLLVPVGHWFLWLFDVIWHFGPVYKKHTNTPPTNRSSGGLTTSGARAKRGFPLVLNKTATDGLISGCTAINTQVLCTVWKGCYLHKHDCGRVIF